MATIERTPEDIRRFHADMSRLAALQAAAPELRDALIAVLQTCDYRTNPVARAAYAVLDRIAAADPQYRGDY